MEREAIRNLLGPEDALIVVDVQPDFCPGGTLAVEGGDEVIPVLNEWLAAAAAEAVPVYASRDFHPPGHPSFEDQGGRWPPHCVQGTHGAAYHPDLALPEDAIKIAKGVRLDRDQHSAFDDTGLADDLHARGVTRVFIGGLAEDVCVRATALSALDEGFETHVIADATRPVTPEGGAATRGELAERGAHVAHTAELAA